MNTKRLEQGRQNRWRVGDLRGGAVCNQSDNTYRLMPIDVIEGEDNYLIKANLPGFNKKDLKIGILENELSIEAIREKMENMGHGLILCERFKGNFKRVLELNESCDTDNIKAEFNNGVLSLKIMKKQPKPLKNIVIE